MTYQVKWFEKFALHQEEFDTQKAAEARYEEVHKMPGVQAAYVFHDKYLVRAVEEDWYPGIDGGQTTEPDEWPLRSMTYHRWDDETKNAFYADWRKKPKTYSEVGDGSIAPRRWANRYGDYQFDGQIDLGSMEKLLSHFNRLYELGVLLEAVRKQVIDAHHHDEPLDLDVLDESVEMAVEELALLLNVETFDDSGRWEEGVNEPK